MVEWFYSQFGQTKGPIAENKLINMVLKEELELDDYVMNPKDELWKKIRDVQHLIDKIHEPEKAIPHKVEFGANFFEDGDVRAGNLYFFIPIQRLVIMTIISGGLYQYYWFYKQYAAWQHKRNQQSALTKRSGGMLAAIFGLFSNIENDRDLSAHGRPGFNGTLLFWSWALLGSAFSGVAYTASNNLILYFFLAAVGWTFGVLFLLPIQRYINRVNEKLGNTFEKPGFGHYACILGGIIILIYTINVRQIWKLFDPQMPEQQTDQPIEPDFGV